MKVLDLFCGMGGFSLGFKNQGFNLTGIDINKYAGLTYEYNKIGKFIQKDLLKEMYIEKDVDIIIGGPPCQPWSKANNTKKKENHQSYPLISVYFNHILEIKPKFIVYENVPPTKKEKQVIDGIQKLKQNGYYVYDKFIYYSDYGTCLKRERYFIFASKNEKDILHIQKRLEEEKKQSMCVGNVISKYFQYKENEFSEHVWSKRDTKKIKYRIENKIRMTAKDLRFTDLVPSITSKCELIHPIYKDRILSIRELLTIFGFPEEYKFPKEVSLTQKYKMIANAVSPIFSEIVAKIIKEII